MTEELEEQTDQVDLCKDLIFRAAFGDSSTNYVLKCLLNAVMEQAELPLIADIELQNPFQLPVKFDRKSSIMDIHAVDETGRLFDIEMQVHPEKSFGDRLLYYGAGVYKSGLEKGDGYEELPKVVCIAFINFPINPNTPDVWFDKWQMHSTLGTGLGTDKMTNLFIRLPRVSRKEASPPDKFTEQLYNWVRILSSYPQLTDKERLELSDSTKGFVELEQRIKYYFGTEEGKRVFIAQRTIDSWLNSIQTEQGALYEEEHKARLEAERRSEEAERRSEEAERQYIERQKKMIVRLFRRQFGAEAALPENWAEGRSADDLDVLADKIDACATLEEALAVLEK